MSTVQLWQVAAREGGGGGWRLVSSPFLPCSSLLLLRWWRSRSCNNCSVCGCGCGCCCCCRVGVGADRLLLVHAVTWLTTAATRCAHRLLLLSLQLPGSLPSSTCPGSPTLGGVPGHTSCVSCWGAAVKGNVLSLPRSVLQRDLRTLPGQHTRLVKIQGEGGTLGDGGGALGELLRLLLIAAAAACCPLLLLLLLLACTACTASCVQLLPVVTQ